MSETVPFFRPDESSSGDVDWVEVSRMLGRFGGRPFDALANERRVLAHAKRVQRELASRDDKEGIIRASDR